ncbi:MBL fold metallo-hydrolase [Cellulomonas sp. P22]|uniref:MBL fold metallo-hydrolase n=1 Tax=Cellulomonas sp. P22 TaxID=3373189 RepID=UPI00379B6418
MTSPRARETPDASDALEVTWLGHASTVLDLDGVRVLTDPLLRRHAGLLRRRGAAPAAGSWAAPDAVLVSHLHHDHAELGSLRLTDPAPVVAAPANAAWLRRHGVPPAVGLRDGDWWRVPGSDVRVRSTPAVHGDRPMPHRPDAANGFLVAGRSATVWFAGDTELFPALSGLAELSPGGVDLALVPVGGWGPRLSGGHLDPVQAARACAQVGARYAVPVHWGTLHAPAARRLPPGWMDRAGPAFAVAVQRWAPGCTALVLEPGQRVRVPRRR